MPSLLVRHYSNFHKGEEKKISNIKVAEKIFKLYKSFHTVNIVKVDEMVNDPSYIDIPEDEVELFLDNLMNINEDEEVF
eukprot:8539461-Ditylum_brightwellii.AAC.1